MLIETRIIENFNDLEEFFLSPGIFITLAQGAYLLSTSLITCFLISLTVDFLCNNIWSENFFSIIKLIFQGKREFCLFYYHAILKGRLLFQ